MPSKGVLFKWEEVPGFEHHCGVCDRPLARRKAKTACFSHHAEPCRRFHQLLFMIGRSHQCQACLSAEDAHLKRHREIAELLREMYEMCGLYIPLEPPSSLATRPHRTGEPKNHDNENQDDHVNLMPTPAEKRVTKKQKKTTKKAARAAQRAKFLTSGEIQYVGEVIHPRKNPQDDADGPSNDEEIEEIERNLRYHANVYNNSQPRSIVKTLNSFADNYLDFDTEMSRIMEALRVSELIGGNGRGSGLMGKELRGFETLVELFKRSVTEVLLQVKKEDLEMRIRRAGYLRFVNRQNYEVMLKRHEKVDWKTGEKIRNDDKDDRNNAD